LLTAAARAAACTWKFTVFDPAGTVTEEGSVIPGVALARLTAIAVPPVGAADSMVTVHVADPGVATVTGEQESVRGDEGGARASEKLAEPPPKLATMIPVAAVLTEAACAENVPLADPAAMLTEAGIVRGAEFAPNDRSTEVALQTADFRVTVHVAVAGVTREAGLQATLFSVLADERIVSAPPVAVAGTLEPAADAPTALSS
jgi:hypothetical protein